MRIQLCSFWSYGILKNWKMIFISKKTAGVLTRAICRETYAMGSEVFEHGRVQRYLNTDDERVDGLTRTTRILKSAC